MTEHGFLAVMLALVVSEVVGLGLVLGYFTYRIHQILERMEGVGPATFLDYGVKSRLRFCKYLI